MDGEELSVILSYNTLPQAQMAFWHLSITPTNEKPMRDYLVDELVVSFFDTTQQIMELPDEVMEPIRVGSPYQRQFSQVAI